MSAIWFTRLRRWAIRFGLLALALLAWAAQGEPARAQIRADALAGEPFGVGRVELRLPPDMLPEDMGLSGIGLTEKDGRVLYPAVEKRLLRTAIRDLLNRPQVAVIYFLFQGNAPLTLTVQARVPQTFVLPPVNLPQGPGALLGEWWRAYNARPGLTERSADYPPLVENYLRASLARRLGLPPVERRSEKPWQQQIEQELGIALAGEPILLSMERDRFLGDPALAETADQPPPAPIPVPPLDLPPAQAGVQVEPLAMRVPAECLYVRFGSFTNFLWLQDTLALWGGDLRNLVLLRGLDFETNRRIESQLVIRQTELGRLLGETVIADVGIIGNDLSFKQGAAFGLLFQARHGNPLFATDLLRQRTARLQQGDAKEEKITLAGKQVSLLTSNDGSVHSYYAVDGDYHLVTTSRTLARRFLETADGRGSLGSLPEFRRARAIMPLARGDTAFVYLSDAFFRNLISPAYRIETQRRMQALADLELVQLAVLDAATEGKPGGNIDALVAGGYLPAGFGPRPDGSRTLIAEGEAVDSVRGHRGRFLPIPDMPLVKVSPSEAAAYARFAEVYQSNWGRLDPVLAGIRRHVEAPGLERIEVDARMTPVDKRNFDTLKRFAGPADQKRMAPVPGNAISAELILPTQRLFAGVQGFAPGLPATQDNAFSFSAPALPSFSMPSSSMSILGLMPLGYVGSIGNPFLVGLAAAGGQAPNEVQGFSVGPLGLARYHNGLVTAYSFQRDLLQQVVPQLQLVDAPRPAQLRVEMNDLSHDRLAAVANRLAYARTRLTSEGNLRLLHSLQQQLHVPGPHAKEAAELLLDARLIDPLGGQYVYRGTPDGGYWTATSLEGSPRSRLLVASPPPPGLLLPPLSWFRGLSLDALLDPETLTLHASILMQKPAKPSPPNNNHAAPPTVEEIPAPPAPGR
jgi:hypothetical protein